MDDQKIRMEVQFVGKVEAEELAKASTRLAISTEEVAEAAEKAKGKVAGFGQSALQSGRVIQDFAQGGLGGILNNIEGLTMALGLGPGLAGVLTIAGVALMVFKPQLEELAKSFGALKPPIVDDLTSVDGLTEALKRNSESLKKMSEDTVLVFNDLKKFNAATEKQIELEGILAAVREKDRLKKMPGKTPGDEGAADIEAVVKEVGGKQALADIEKALVGKFGTFGKERDKRSAEVLLSNARAGHMDALDLMTEMFGGFGGSGAGTATEKAFADPGGKKFDVSAKAETERAKKARDAADARKKADDKHVDELNELGLANEQAMRDEARKERLAQEAHEKELKKKQEEESSAARIKVMDKSRKGLEEGNLDEMAAVTAAEFRAGRGSKRFTPDGPIPLSDEKQRDAVRKLVDQEIRRRMPGLDKEARETISGEVAGEGFAEADKARSEEALKLNASGLDKATRNQITMGNTLEVLRMQLEDTNRRLNAISAAEAARNDRARTIAPDARSW